MKELQKKDENISKCSVKKNKQKSNSEVNNYL